MKTILIAFMLLTVGTAGADTVEDGSKDIRAHQTYCEHKMDQAMKAMEPFLIGAWHYETGKTYSLAVEFELMKLHTAFKQWDEAKRECWKEKP